MDEIGEGPAALDTSVFIYWIEEHATYHEVVTPVFHAADAGRLDLVSSALALLEILVVPHRAGRLELAERYEQLLTRARNVRLVDIDRSQLRQAAQLRALHGLRTPDALQIAAALTVRSPIFVTNDCRLPRIPGLEIVQIADYA